MANQSLDKLYEPIIRKAAGLGHAPTEPDPDHYSNRFAHCDVLVIGGGAAGLMAAKAAADKNKKVIICDENPAMGGWLLSDTDILIDGKSGHEWATNMVESLKAMPNVRALTRTTGFGYFQQNMVGLIERVTEHLSNPASDLPRERMWQVRAEKVIIARVRLSATWCFPTMTAPAFYSPVQPKLI